MKFSTSTKITIKGDISEIIAPWSMDCVDSVKELRFLGSPIDFVGFKGLDGEGEIEIKFIEVKSGKSTRIFVLEWVVEEMERL